MNFLKRIGFFLLTNIAVLAVVSIILIVLQSVFGINLQGNSTSSLILYCLIFGMTGSVISLFMSKWIAKKSMNIQMITPETANTSELAIYNMVKDIAQKANVKMPEFGIYHSSDVNAFATGWSKNNSLVAVSTGLLRSLNTHEIEAVLAHEVAHIKNGDMVTLSLIQGVVNAFVIFLSKITSDIIRREFNDSIGTLLYNVIYIALQIVFGFLATPIVMYFSRIREYKADEGASQLVGKWKMISALKTIQSKTEEDELPQEMQVMAISNKSKSLFGKLYSSHPDIEKRIKSLEMNKNLQ